MKTLIITAILSFQASAMSLIPKTNLGPIGNKSVAENFIHYQNEFSTKGCEAKENGKRVILTGFGLFSGVNYNISGAVVSSMGSSQFFPAQIDLDNLPTKVNDEIEDGHLSSHPLGVNIVNRSLNLNGKKFEICFITANVEWDFAAAIFINEMRKFKPELILMTGRGGANVSLEVGALNNAMKASGYSSNGDSEAINTPVINGEKLLMAYPKNKILKLNWHADLVNSSIQELVSTLGFQTELQTTARTSNTYICNNVSFVVAHAASNKSTSLAGGRLVLPGPELKILPKVGFFHFPSVDESYPEIKNYTSQVFSWGTVLAQTIYSQFY